MYVMPCVLSGVYNTWGEVEQFIADQLNIENVQLQLSQLVGIYAGSTIRTMRNQITAVAIFNFDCKGNAGKQRPWGHVLSVLQFAPSWDERYNLHRRRLARNTRDCQKRPSNHV